MPFATDFKARSRKNIRPTEFTVKGARARAATPFQIVCPADESIPKRFRNVFVNHRDTARSQHALDFRQQ